MDLNDADLKDLAAFFGRRLDPTLAHTPPPADAREAKQRTAAWRLVLEDAAEQNRLSGLFTRIQRRYPNDEQLQHALALLLEPGRRSDAVIGALLLASAAAGFLIMSTGITGGGALYWYTQQQPTLTHARLGQVTIATLQTGEERFVHRSEALPPTGRCTVPEGGPVGYWYAGASTPGASGDLVHLTGAVNVRTDYPGHHNRYDARTHIHCVLQPGDNVLLSSEPMQVPGGSWWVALQSGDLLPS